MCINSPLKCRDQNPISLTDRHHQAHAPKVKQKRANSELTLIQPIYYPITMLCIFDQSIQLSVLNNHPAPPTPGIWCWRWLFIPGEKQEGLKKIRLNSMATETYSSFPISHHETVTSIDLTGWVGGWMDGLVTTNKDPFFHPLTNHLPSPNIIIIFFFYKRQPINHFLVVFG